MSKPCGTLVESGVAGQAIEVEQLSRTFGKVEAVAGLSFAVAEGEVFGMLGPNGAGKTTTVRVLNGIIAPSSGRVRVLGLDPIADGSAVRRQSGVLTETPSLYDRLTARENLHFYGALYGVPEGKLAARVDELLDFFGLAERQHQKVGRFSKGMKQRLALARTLIHTPPLLFFDEPTAALDPEAAHQVSSLIEQLSRQGGRTIFLCTHNLDEAERLCDRVAVLNRGKLLALGTREELARALWHSHWLDFTLRVPPAPALLAALRNAPGVRGVQSEDSTLAVHLDGEAAIPGVVATVAALGGQIIRVNPREHSLQEIYLELQKRGRNGEEARS